MYARPGEAISEEGSHMTTALRWGVGGRAGSAEFLELNVARTGGQVVVRDDPKALPDKGKRA